MDLIFVLGGTNCGKTGFAEKTARDYEIQTGRKVIYLATATAGDDEMKTRINNHKKNRPNHWITREETIDIEKIPEEINESGFILMDCLTLWITNLLMTIDEESLDRKEAENLILPKLNVFLESISQKDGCCCIVSNLVEEGLLSPWKLGRVYQDLSGACHQLIARQASSVYHVMAGIPVKIKG